MTTGFQSEKKRAIAQPVREALNIDLARGDKLIFNAESNEPATRYAINNENVVYNSDLRRIDKICRTSATFLSLQSWLKRHRITVRTYIKKLPVESGGGRTYGDTGSSDYQIEVWPPIIHAGFHVIDIYLHEWGHVAESTEGSLGYLAFLNTVQQELGLRTTRESHVNKISKHPINTNFRDPFKRGSR